MDWHTTSDLIKCKYNIFDGDKMSVDSTWINIGTLPYRNNDLFLYVSHHLVSTFSIDDQKFQIGVHDGQNKFCFQHPLVAIISENGLRKDSLPKTDLLKEGEYLKLGDRYYRFEDVSNGGKFITLIKEDDVSNKTGTQVGFKALDFKCVSMTGDSIELRDFNNEYLLITNVTSCYSKPSSYIHYKDLTDEYKDRIDFLCLDKSPIILNNNIKGLNLNGIFINVNENKELEKYRLDFCSRTCFLINPEGQIIDKFEIRDWKNALEKHFTIH